KKIMKEADPTYQKVAIDPLEDLALLQYTGGTTGYPLGVMHTHDNLVAFVHMGSAWVYKTEGRIETVLRVMTCFHVYGVTTLMTVSIMSAAKRILVPKLSTKEVVQTNEKQRPTLIPGTPTIYVGLINQPDIEVYDLSSIEACISGSATLPLEVQERFEK